MKEEDYSKYYIQDSDHYLIPKDVFKELYNEMNNWKHDFKQLESNWNELKKWLEEEIKSGRSEDNQWLMGCYDFAKDVLDKMKELDDKDEKDNSI